MQIVTNYTLDRVRGKFSFAKKKKIVKDETRWHFWSGSEVATYQLPLCSRYVPAMI